MERGMGEVGAFDAKNRLGQLLDAAERGEETVITRHGRPVARLVPAERGFDRAAAQAALRRLRARAAAVQPAVSLEEILARRDEGRR
jgi:prevent-host-death family protein